MLKRPLANWQIIKRRSPFSFSFRIINRPFSSCKNHFPTFFCIHSSAMVMAMAIGMNKFCMIEDHLRDQPKQQGGILNTTDRIHSHKFHTDIHVPRIWGILSTHRTATAFLSVLVLVRPKSDFPWVNNFLKKGWKVAIDRAPWMLVLKKNTPTTSQEVGFRNSRCRWVGSGILPWPCTFFAKTFSYNETTNNTTLPDV